MRNILYSFLAVASLASCASQFNIQGSSDLQNLDGHMLHLKAIKGDELKSIDSCDVVHGQFAFRGNLDTVKVAALYISDQSVMPVVLEEGDIVININNAKQTCTGSPLNDRLSEFIEGYNQIINQFGDLTHQHDQALMNGDDMAIVTRQLNEKAASLEQKYDSCITSFIENNFDNILGSFVFQMVTGDMQIPLSNAWIDAIMAKATDTFKNDPYVKGFMEAANKNQAIMTGMEDQTQVLPPTPDQLPGNSTPTPDPVQGGSGTVPTPNQLASPQQ